jgi:hypothetical protein
MDTINFLKSTGGRLLALTTAFACAGAGSVALAGPGSDLLLSIVPLACIAGCIVAVGMSIEAHVEAAAALVIGLPFVAALYSGVLALAVDAGRPTAVLFFVLALGPMWLALRGYEYVAEPTPRMA